MIREARLAAANAALQPYGFVIDPSFADGLRAYAPFTLLPSPERYVAGARGSIEGERVEAYEYTHTSTDADGETSTHSELVVALHHRAIRGAAAFAPEHREWSALAAFIDAALWVPPFTFLKVFQLLEAQRNPDRLVGREAFDRLYRVRAASEAAAREAIPPRLVEVVLGIAFRGAIEVRPGVLLFRSPAGRFDAATIVAALGVGVALLGAYQEDPRQGYRG